MTNADKLALIRRGVEITVELERQLTLQKAADALRAAAIPAKYWRWV